ncbi:MAG: terminase gpA endonuclease subunit, partial [Parachlamydiaceae bacterium]
HKQYLKFKNLKWPDEDPKAAYFECEAQKCKIEHRHKRSMIEKGEWIPTAESKNLKWVGFHIWAAYSYSPNSTWGHIAAEFLEAKRAGPEALQTFVNTVEGEAFSQNYAEKTNVKDLQGRAEAYALGTAPEKVLLCVCGVDVQDNRLAIEVVGYGHEDEAFVINYMEIYGNPAETAVWKQLDLLLDAPIVHPKYEDLKIKAAAIDSGGHFTHEVYQYVRDRRHKSYIAIKGATQRNKPAIGKPTLQDINIKGKSLKKGVQLYSVGTDTIKNVLHSRLKLLEPGAKYIHFSNELPDDFYRGIVSERKIVKIKRGQKVTEWVKHNSHTRNEPWDCMVYAFAAKELVLSKYPRKLSYSAIEKELVLKKTDEQEKVKPPVTKKAPQKNQNGGGFANRW